MKNINNKKIIISILTILLLLNNIINIYNSCNIIILLKKL